MNAGITRRRVLQSAAAGTVAAGAGAVAVGALDSAEAEPLEPAEGVLDLYVNEGFVPMVDGSLVYMRGFGNAPTDLASPDPSLRVTPSVFLADGTLVSSRSYPVGAEHPPEGRPGSAGPHPTRVGESLVRRAHWASYFPDRTIVAETGATVRIRVQNRLREPHELAIPGIASTGAIAPGATAELEFPAPAPGTYLYADPGNEPVERVLGLHGVLIVVPADSPWLLSPSGPEFERQWLWLCQDVDPEWARRAHAGERIDPAATPAVPRYFMLNDRSGYLSIGVSDDDAVNLATHEETIAAGCARPTDARDFSKPDGSGSVVTGQLLRLVNAGVVVHQMHFHGNHVWTVRRNGADFPRSGGRVDAEGHVVLQQWEDVVELDPRDRKEIVLPFKRPPDAIDPVWEARTEDWHYPMHCHAEPSQTAAGGLYPGGIVADWVLAAPDGSSSTTEHPHFSSQVEYALNQPREGSPETEFRQRPDRTFVRKFYGRRLRFPDGAEHEMWSFEDDRSGRRFPAPLIRVTEGEIVHVELEASKRTHTIHLHGMEPDPRNDGVGHTSFEVSGDYTYQFRPEPGVPGDPNGGAAGSYFYHCHVNTVLHVQMGMVGAMLIDPAPHPDFPVPAGARRPFVDGPLYDVATEAMLVPYSVDPRWHELNHDAGTSGEDVGLNRFDPKHFYLLGGPLAGGPPRGDVMAATRLRANLPETGHPTLLRVLNLNYFPTRARFTDEAGRPVVMAELLAHDGRAFRDTSDPTGVSPPIRETGHPLTTNAIAFGAAERYDMLLQPPRAGTFWVHVDWIHWVTGRVLATRSIPLVVA